MASAAERAEARRKAILSRKGDRLAKLTTSARGEDAPAFIHDDPPLPSMPNVPNLRQFVGEETPLPTPPSESASLHNSVYGNDFPFSGIGTGRPDPSIWSEEQQRQLLSALMGGGGAGAAPFARSRTTSTTARTPSETHQPLPGDNPLAALMAMMPPDAGTGGPDAFKMPPGMNMFPEAPTAPVKKTFAQRMLPIVHLFAAWFLFAFFAFWKEPGAYETQRFGATGDESLWRRWSELGYKPVQGTIGVAVVPFFWAFTTLTIVLHSWRIFKGVDPIRPPLLLSFALPHLPSPLPSIILTTLKYLQIGGVFLDDIAALLFGVGFLIWLSSWFTS